jgi:Kef-type K+ transport system membrane component KefB
LITLAAEQGGVALDLLAVIACAGLVPLLLSRLRVALIPGYLIAGVIIGPVLGVVDSPDRIEEISSLAIILLMFTIGLHLDFRSLRSAAGPIVGVGIGSTVATAGLVAVAAMALGLGWKPALVVGLALDMSSTAAVLKLLQQRRELNRPHGRLAFGVLIMQDLAVVAVLAVVPVLGGSDPETGGFGADRALLHLLVVGAIIAFGRLAVTRVMAYAMRVGGVELVLVLGSAAALGAAVATAAVGLSAELGAFVAGLLLAASPVRYQLAGQLAPLRDLFMALFFTSVGLAVDPASIGTVWWVLLITVPLLLTIKFAVLALTSWAGGASPAVSARVGLTLAQSGEFSLVVLLAAGKYDLLDTRAEAVVIATVFLSLLLTPALVAASGRIGPLGRLSRLAPWMRQSVFVETGGGPSAAPSPVIIAGFGPVGRACAERLEKAGIRYAIIELNARTVGTQHRLGREIIYGDATNPAVLESAGVEHARALILTILDEQAMLSACGLARQANPEIFIAARAAVLSHAIQATEIGADVVMVDEIAAARAMSDEVVKRVSGLRDGADRHGRNGHEPTRGAV